eukprot:970245-Pleurochrysis_carterae.AAC.2
MHARACCPPPVSANFCRLRIEHGVAVLLHLEARDERELLRKLPVERRRRGRPKHERVAQDAREHQPRHVRRRRAACCLRTRVEDAARRAERTHVNLQWLASNQTAELVMVDNGVHDRPIHSVGELLWVVCVDHRDGVTGRDALEQRRCL